MKVVDLSEEEKATLKEWDKAKVRWWIYTPTQLKKLEREVAKINEKLDKE